MFKILFVQLVLIYFVPVHMYTINAGYNSSSLGELEYIILAQKDTFCALHHNIIGKDICFD